MKSHLYRLTMLATLMLSVGAESINYAQNKTGKISTSLSTPVAVFADDTPVSQDEARAAVIKLSSLVRFYYPSEEVASADWDRLNAYALRLADTAKTRGELVQALSKSMHPVAPAMSINGYQRKPLPQATGTRVAWHYSGSLVAKNYNECLADFGIPPEPYKTYSRWREFVTTTTSPYFPAHEHFQTTIDGGISVDLPVVLPTRKKRALPAGFPLPAEVANESITPGSIYANLSAAATTWATYQNFFPYREEINVDMQSNLPALLNDSQSAGDVDNLTIALKRFTAKFEDGHNFYVPGTRTDGTTTNGMFDSAWIENKLVITWLAPDYHGPVQLGDIVLKIRNQTTAEFFAERTPLIPLAPEKKAIYLANIWSIYGDKVLPIRVRHADASEADITLTREPWSNAITAKWAARALPIVNEVEPGIFVINEANTMDIDAVVKQLAAAKAVILDTRYGVTGNNWQLVTHFLPEGMLTQDYEQRHDTLPWQTGNINLNVSWQQPVVTNQISAKLIVIMNRNTQSSGETYLNFFKETHHGTLIGEATHGANGDISCARLLGGPAAGGLTFFYTGLHVANRDGSQHQSIGTLPDIEVKQTIAGVRAGRDELMEKALQLAKAN